MSRSIVSPSSLSLHVSGVFGATGEEEVRRIDTGRVIACVTRKDRAINRSVYQHESIAVCSDSSLLAAGATDTKEPVSGFVSRSCPEPAARGLGNVSPEPGLRKSVERPVWREAGGPVSVAHGEREGGVGASLPASVMQVTELAGDNLERAGASFNTAHGGIVQPFGVQNNGYTPQPGANQPTGAAGS